MSTTATAQMPAGVSFRMDLEHLQGPWRTVAGRRGARFLIAENRFTFEFIDGEVYLGTFHLDPAAAPKQMDMRIEEGPLATRGQLAHCIYHVDEQVLRWCSTVPGAGYRLTRFPSVDDDHYYSLVFRRDRPNRSH